MTHTFPIRVYYEDTDLAGIVYYANYLRFIERARTEWVRSLGVDQVRLRREEGIVFAVRRIEADYLRPAKFDDELAVTTRPAGATGARIVLEQEVLRGGERLFAAAVTLVCLTETGAPARIPAEIRSGWCRPCIETPRFRRFFPGWREFDRYPVESEGAVVFFAKKAL